MKKILSFLIMFSLLFGVVGVIGDEPEPDIEIQNLNANVEGVIDISVNNIDYGSVIPGDSSDQNSVVTVGDNNNVDLTVNIQVTDAGTESLFEHIIFDLDSNGFDESEIGATTISKEIADGSGANTIPTRLQVPAGFAPGAVSGTVSYTAMKDITP